MKPNNSNPCGICRAMRLPFCRGHARGGGGSDDSDEAQSGKKSASAKSSANFASLIKMLESDKDWHQADESDLLFVHTFSDSWLNIVLDMENGLLTFVVTRNLNAEEQKVLDKLFDAIQNELTVLGAEFPADRIKIERNSHTLSIRVSSPEHFDCMIQRLFEKNLLPCKASGWKDGLKQTRFSPSEEIREEKSNLSPFDLRGPGSVPGCA